MKSLLASKHPILLVDCEIDSYKFESIAYSALFMAEATSAAQNVPKTQPLSMSRSH